MPLPSVSVCLLTYKRARELPRVIEALLAQDHADFELIINDDCSPDETEEVCRRYARVDSRVRYFKNRENLRYANNQSAAILRASHEHVAIVHDSDVYEPNLLSRWTQALLDHPSAALVFNQARQLNLAGEVVGMHKHDYGPLIPGRQLADDMLARADSPIFGIVMVRRSRVVEVGPFDPRMPTLADVDMWLRLSLRYDVAYVAEPLYAIAAREQGHHNSYDNWNVRRESELIFELNWRRRFATDPESAERVRRMIARHQLRVRALCLAACVKHGRWQAAKTGLSYVLQQPPFGARVLPEAVTSWQELAQRIGTQSTQAEATAGRA